ncbi:MAG: TonB-dependent receptor [Treponema sp.]|nr:TonB-dependent receptor [Treponema sp.]
MHTKFAFFAALFFSAALSLFARDVQVLVEDVELNLPLEGAVIRSWDGTQYACDDNGIAVVTVPDNRQVLIQAAYPGYETGRLVVTLDASRFTVGLRLSGIMEGRELVIEAARPGSSETRTGRSVAVSGRDIAQTAEIGIVEDVMSSVKLLPGVGYAGFFNAQPSIRGGDPGDLSASLDGYYVMNPYHWGGGFSIFDPRMVQSAQLSHGVFSTRYGHTISGLLEITTKEPSATETEFELGINTSAANFNFSFPLAGRGGILAMGRVTYQDPVIWLAKQMATFIEALGVINYIRQAPYIRSGTVTGNYRFLDNLELHATGFWGMDGVGVTFENSSRGSGLDSDTDIVFDWANYQGFFTTGLSWNPRSDMLLKFTAGLGYEESVIDGNMQYDITNKHFSANFISKYKDLSDFNYISESYQFETDALIKQTDTMFNVQGRVDYDWDIGRGFILAAGLQEMFAQFSSKGHQQSLTEVWFGNLNPAEQQMIKFLYPGLAESTLNDLRVNFPRKYDPDAGNKMLTTSGYGLAEYSTPGNRFSAELGLRVDHYYLLGRGFSLQTKPALNPRLNLDFNVFKNRWIVQSFDLSAGTGLFSSMNSNIMLAEKEFNIKELKPNRSWTSVLGAKLEFSEGLSFNIEGYHKYIFDRMYAPVNFSLDSIDVQPQFNGEGRVWGIDMMIQKLQSRYWDGWLSYSFSWAKYLDPGGGYSSMGISGGTSGNDWYFPSYHRFHNLNLVLNIRPTPRINIYTRFGLASGVQLSRRIAAGPTSYPVLAYYPDENPPSFQFIEKYYWPSVRDENNRTTPSLPMDIKLSIFGKNASGKARYEVYVAVENVLALLYSAEGNTSYNQYTGEVDNGSNSASYEIPIPIPSFGFKFSY